MLLGKFDDIKLHKTFFFQIMCYGTRFIPTFIKIMKEYTPYTQITDKELEINQTTYFNFAYYKIK